MAEYKQIDNAPSATPKKALLDWEYLAKNGYAPRPPYEEMNLKLIKK